MAQEAVDFAINPAAPDQILVLWSNGRLYGRGGVVVPDEYEDWRQELYDAYNHPTFFGRHFMRLQVTSWAPLGGYVLREFGATGQSCVKEFGNAQPPGTLGPSSDPQIFNSIKHGGLNLLRAFAMDPAANGNGYIMSRFGRIYRCGIPTALTTNLFVTPQSNMMDMAMEYSTRKTVLLDAQGRLFMGNGSVYAGTSEKDSDTLLSAKIPKWQHSLWTDLMRRVKVVDWTTVATKPKGYVLDGWGYIHRFNSPELPIIRHVWRDRSVARALHVLNYPAPFAYNVMAYNGNTFEVNSSTPPTVSIVNPGTVTTTTRPYVEWDVTDKELDHEDFTEVHFFHTGTFTPGTTVPAEKQMLRGSVLRAARPELALPNGTVGIAVRVTETARPGRNGLVSAWDSETWTQSTTRPIAPVINTVTPAAAPPSVTVGVLSDAAAIGRVCDLEYTDVASPTEADWKRVRWYDGAGGLPIYFNFTGIGAFNYVDREVPAGVARKYRCRTIINDVDNYNSSLWSTTSALTTSSIPPKSWYIVTPEVTAAEAPSMFAAIKVAPGQTLEHGQRVSSNLPLDGTQRGAIVTRTRPRSRRLDLSLWVLTEAEYTALFRILEDGRVFTVQDVLGRIMYCQLAGSPQEMTIKSGPDLGTPYPMKHAHQVTVPVIEVRRPPVPDRMEILV